MAEPAPSPPGNGPLLETLALLDKHRETLDGMGKALERACRPAIWPMVNATLEMEREHEAQRLVAFITTLGSGGVGANVVMAGIIKGLHRLPHGEWL